MKMVKRCCFVAESQSWSFNNINSFIGYYSDIYTIHNKTAISSYFLGYSYSSLNDDDYGCSILGEK